MIINDLDIFGAAGRPAEAHPELVVYPDAVLPGAVTLESFEPIPRRHPQVFQSACDLQLSKLAPSHCFDALEPLDSSAVRKGLRFGTLERNDHVRIVLRRVINVKRDGSTEIGQVSVADVNRQRIAELLASDDSCQGKVSQLPGPMSRFCAAVRISW